MTISDLTDAITASRHFTAVDYALLTVACSVIGFVGLWFIWIGLQVLWWHLRDRVEQKRRAKRIESLARLVPRRPARSAYLDM